MKKGRLTFDIPSLIPKKYPPKIGQPIFHLYFIFSKYILLCW